MASSSEEGLRRVEGKVRERFGIGPFGSGFASAFRGRRAEASGLIDDAYENVWLRFRDMFKARSDLGAQVCVYVKGRKVVDLSGHSVHSTTKSYDSDSLQCIYSSGKNLEAYCIARLVEQGLVEYTDTVASHWPEFGQHGKDKLTVADVFRHEGGLIGFTHPDHYDDPKHDFTLNVEDLQERSRIASKIESSGLWYGVGNKGVKKRVYHAHTRGFIISELVHRIDPQKRYIDQFFDEEFAKPLDLSIYCALSPEAQKLHHYAAMKQPSLAYTICFMVIPAMIGLGDKEIKSMIKLVTSKTNPLIRTAWKGSGNPVTPKYNNTVLGRSLEFTSAGVHANASSLAKFHAALASGGKVDGKQVLQPSTIERMLSDVTVAHDLSLGRETGFSQGGLGELSFVGPEFKNFYGWIGWGGSVFIFDPVREISFAFTLNGMGLKLTGDKRSASLLAEVLKTYNATNDVSLS